MYKNLPTDYQTFIHLSRYARWLPEEGRRESWEETVDRCVTYLCDVQCSGKVDDKTKKEIRNCILNLEVMPSMRLLMTAGKAAERDNCAAYNCAYLIINRPRAFSEVLYILMCGTGVGFSVERQEINKLPEVPEKIYPSDTVISFSDSRIGWATGIDELISLLYAGKQPKFDFSKIREAGARLKTFGGRASGPDPLKDLCNFVIAKFHGSAGRKLNSLEVHDIVCKIAEIVVVGGVRRSALISLSNLSDDRMRGAKSGEWWVSNPQRALANNSACYDGKPEPGSFMTEWHSLYESKSGERGIFNRKAATSHIKNCARRDPDYSFGCNPCSEILLRDRQFCNLTEVVIRSTDTLKSLKRKMRVATILGTLQSTFVDFRYLSKEWKKNCEEERLLGVSLTGIMDNEFMSNKRLSKDFIDDSLLSKSENKLHAVLETLKLYAIQVNKEWAKKLDINASVAITCTKPSGTVSQLVDSASGIHSRYSKYYIRTIRADKKDPLGLFLKSMGVPCEDDVMQPNAVDVFSFPIASPAGAVTNEDRSALEQLELWLAYKTFYCEHKPSVTINVKEDEWLDVGAWVYKHFDQICGISFLPWVTHSYRQAPYQPIDEVEYKEALAKMPSKIDWDELKRFEVEDSTQNSKEYACSGPSCEIVDLVSK